MTQHRIDQLVAQTMAQPAGARYTYAYGVLGALVASSGPDALADARAFTRALETAMQTGLTHHALSRV